MKKIITAIFTVLFIGASTIYVNGLATPRKSAKRNKIANLKTANLLDYAMQAAPLYMGKRLHKNWQRGVKTSKEDIKIQKQLFGYNLGIEHIIDNNPSVVKPDKHVTLYLHGWGDQRNSAKLGKTLDVLPGDVITFNFPDSSVIIPRIHRSSLGQLPDVLPALYTLKWAKDNLGVESVDLFGYSRGGATAVNIIAVLADKSGKYDSDVANIGIDTIERNKLLQLLQNGSIVLNCPLRDMNTTTRQFFRWINPEIPLKILETVGKYKRDGLQAITSTGAFKGLGLKTLVHFQYNDTVVSDKDEAEFYQRIARHNPQGTYLLLGDDGGHLHTQNTLSQAIQTFRKAHGGAYDSEYGNVPLAPFHYKNHDDAQLVQPYPYSKEYIDQIIRSYYAKCKNSRKRK